MPSAARAELDAAGIIDPALRDGYAVCRALNAHHGRTYFLATRLLPAARRPAVHALYGFARYADEIVDDLADTSPAAEKAARLDELSARLQRALAGAPAEDLAPPTESPPHISTAQLPAERTGEPPEYVQHEGRLAGTPSRNLDPPIYATDFRRGALVLAAVTDTARRYALDPALFADFMASMRMDTMVTEYATFDDLGRYVHGSAAVIGLQMLPILGTTVLREEAEEPAAALGVAFQITNFLRDVGEDLDRGRVYLPTEELAAFGVDRELLTWCRRTRRPDARVRRALAHLVAHTRAIYRRAAPGVGMLEPVSRACVACAFTLYRGILDQIEAADYDVLHRRVSVPRRTRAAVAVPALVRALAARARP